MSHLNAQGKKDLAIEITEWMTRPFFGHFGAMFNPASFILFRLSVLPVFAGVFACFAMLSLINYIDSLHQRLFVDSKVISQLASDYVQQHDHLLVTAANRLKRIEENFEGLINHLYPHNQVLIRHENNGNGIPALPAL